MVRLLAFEIFCVGSTGCERLGFSLPGLGQRVPRVGQGDSFGFEES